MKVTSRRLAAYGRLLFVSFVRAGALPVQEIYFSNSPAFPKSDCRRVNPSAVF